MARIIAATIDHVIAQRVVRRYSIAQPRTDAGRTIYTLALKLTQSTTSDEAAVWGCTTARTLHDLPFLDGRENDTDLALNPKTSTSPQGIGGSSASLSSPSVYRLKPPSGGGGVLSLACALSNAQQ